MKILFMSNSPTMKTGYGMQTAIFAPRIKALGYDLDIFGYCGNQHAEFEWNGIAVLPSGAHAMGMDVISYHYEQSRADVVVALTDCWAMSPKIMKMLPTVCWTPVDNEPLGHTICTFLDEAKPRVIAMAGYGKRMFDAAAAAGRFTIPHPVSYIPHGLPMDVFRPPEDRAALRAASGFGEDTFVVLLNQANRSGLRKGLNEQVLACLKFHQRHPDSKFLLHMAMDHAKGVDLPLLIDRACEAYGYDVPEGTFCFPDQGVLGVGGIAMEEMPGIYGAADVTLQGVMAGGFELPILESQACGTPVIATDGSAMTEVAGPHSWLVPNQPFWVENVHQGFWRMPLVGHVCSACGHEDGIAGALEAAWRLREDGGMDALRKTSREHALQYDADKITRELWAPYLADLEASL